MTRAPLACLCVVVACGAPAHPMATCPVATASVPSAPSALPSATAATPTRTPALPAELAAALDRAAKAVLANDWTRADQELAAAATAAGSEAHFLYAVARLRALRYAQQGDFEHAGAAFVAVMPALAAHPELQDEFWAHNAMMMIREAQGDPAAALAENDQATLAAARGTWEPAERDTLAFQKDRWHRAYLTRMLAESRVGSLNAGLRGYAEAALAEYRTRGFPESVAVLEAYFAALDGKPAEALAAARRVDPTKDDDLEDLYLVVGALEAGGDHAGAAAIRKQMRQPGGLHLARAVMLRWLDLDEKGHGFTPFHPRP